MDSKLSVSDKIQSCKPLILGYFNFSMFILQLIWWSFSHDFDSNTCKSSVQLWEGLALASFSSLISTYFFNTCLSVLTTPHNTSVSQFFKFHLKFMSLSYLSNYLPTTYTQSKWYMLQALHYFTRMA